MALNITALAACANPDNVPEFLWRHAKQREGTYVIHVDIGVLWPKRYSVVLTEAEMRRLEPCVVNHKHGETQHKRAAQLIYQKAKDIWPSGKPEDLAMRTIAPWAICKFENTSSSGVTAYLRSEHLLTALGAGFVVGGYAIGKAIETTIFNGPMPFFETVFTRAVQALGAGGFAKGLYDGYKSTSETAVLELNLRDKRVSHYDKMCEYTRFLFGDGPSDQDRRIDKNYVITPPPGLTCNEDDSASDDRPPTNKLGYVEVGHGNEDHSELNGIGDSDCMIRATRDDRFCLKDVYDEYGRVSHVLPGVVAQTADPAAEKQIKGVVTLPVAIQPNVYAGNEADWKIAIEERYTKKARVPYLNDDDRRRFGELSAAMIGRSVKSCTKAPYSRRKVIEWWEENVLPACKSKKWGESRFENSFEQLLQDLDPQFEYSSAIKYEHMPEGKAPRFLIADGDKGQILSLLVIKCIEDLTKKHFPTKTIKGKGKREAMEDLIKHMQPPKNAKKNAPRVSADNPYACSVFEGDGSAWDTTCSRTIRSCTENPVIFHVAETLGELMFEPESFVDAHTRACTTKEYQLKFRCKKDGLWTHVQRDLDAIRRSGHRGTSALNWLINFMCWAVVLLENPAEICDECRRYFLFRDDTVRWLHVCYEGDDSLLTCCPPILEKSETYETILESWRRFGFNMEIFIRKPNEQALFTGWKFAIRIDGSLGNGMPDLHRLFCGSGVSCSVSSLQSWENGDDQGYIKAVASAALSRAYELSGIVPVISKKYLELFEIAANGLSHKTKFTMSNDELARCFGTPETEYEHADLAMDLAEDIAFQNDRADDDEVLRNLASCGFHATHFEVERFADYPWMPGHFHEVLEFCESLPDSWRSKLAAEQLERSRPTLEVTSMVTVQQ